MRPPSHAVAEIVLPHYGTVTALARALGMNRVNVSRLVNGKAGISARVALALERLGYGHARQWLVAQAEYDLEQERRR